MPTTTSTSVPISAASHQVLHELTQRTGRTAAEVLDRALDAYRRQVFLDEVNAGYAALRADPQAWAALEAERRSMAGCLMDGLDPKESWGPDGDLLPPAEKVNHR